MKEKIFNLIIFLFILLTIIIIFTNNKEIATTIISGLNLFLTRVFPSLFPMFILNDLLISLNIPYYFYILFNYPFTKLFNTSGICAYILFMSLISGTPSSAYIIKNLTSTNTISISEGNFYLYFTYFSNPLFLITMLTRIFPLNITLKIILIHYLSNIILLFILKSKSPKITTTNPPINHSKLTSTLIKSISKSMSTLLVILGTIIFYYLLFFIITNIFPLNSLFKTLIAGLLEITNGLNLLSYLNISLKLKEIIAVAIISFGGLSINTQVKAILEDTPLNFNYFFKGRIYQTLISIIITIFF